MAITLLREYETSPNLQIDPILLPMLKSVFGVSIAPSFARSGGFDITPGSTIGAATFGGHQIVIRPKMPISRVLFLVSYVLDPVHWQDDAATIGSATDLVEATAAMFTRRVRRAFSRGLLQGYVSRTETSTTVRGRWLIGHQLRRWYGRQFPAEIAYDDFTEDVAENQVVKAALRRLLHMRLRSRAVRSELRRGLGELQDTVSDVDYFRGRVPELVWGAQNARYRPAYEMARLILRWTSPELSSGSTGAEAFVIDMNDVVEEFIRVALREELGATMIEFPSGKQVDRLWLDEAHRLRLQPDLSWWSGRACQFVGDVKYKPKPGADDLYQLYAYVRAVGLNDGLLIYADWRRPISHQVVDGVSLHVAGVDLDGQPAAVLASVAAIARRVRAMAESTTADLAHIPSNGPVTDGRGPA